MSPRRAGQLPLTRLFDRHFYSIAALLLVILAGAQIGSAVLESPTNDEPIHLTAGYVYLTTGKYSMDLTHPPLGRILAALPLLPLPLKHIPAERAWLEFKNLIWGNRIPADSIMIRARLVIIALTLLFGAWLAWWTRRHFGSSVALLALAFFVFDPNLIAHGHYVTTDLIVSFGIFLTCTLWADFLHAPGWKKLTLAGFALASKYSDLFGFCEFFLFAAFIGTLGKTEELYDFSGMSCPIIWESDAIGGVKNLKRQIAHAEKYALPFFAVHRRAVQRLDDRSRRTIAEFWHRRCLFPTVSDGLDFLCG